MKFGYPCVNTSLSCVSSRTFRLASYTEERMKETIDENITCLEEILKWNVEHEMYFFRISSQIIPFASHEICTYPWQSLYRERFQKIGVYIQEHDIRISMHPDQFVLINSVNEKIFEQSVKELMYHMEVFELLQLDETHKIQIHVGGVYDDKDQSCWRFIKRFKTLPEALKRRLVIENDDRLYCLKDCLVIHENIHIPVLFDTFHHEIYNDGDSIEDALRLACNTWSASDGRPMVDYSSQESGAREGKHAEHIDIEDFKQKLPRFKKYDCDVMFEIKDKEKSVIEALTI